MKKFLLAILVLSASLVNAAEVTVLDVEYNRGFFNTRTEARFFIDKNTTEGFANVTVTEDHYVFIDHNWGRWGGPMGPTIQPVVVFKTSAKIENLMLMGDKVIYHGAEGDVDCGTLGESRILKRPTLYLTGKCQLQSRIRGQRLTVKLITK